MEPGLGLVGRDDELARMAVALERAVNEQPGGVLLVGDAGVGKTTLLRAAISRAEAEGFVTATGGCAQEARATPFAPFRAALRRLCATRPSEMTAAIGAAPVVGMLLPPSLRPATTRGASPDPAELYDGVLGVLGDLGSSVPVLLAIEDVHWADESTLELLSFIIRNLHGERLVLVATARREDLVPGSPATTTVTELGRLGSTERMDLEGFDLTTLRGLVAATGRHPDEDMLRSLHDRTGGNPFLALELLDVDSSATGALPASVADTLAVRFDRLDADDALVVRSSAVVDEMDAELLAEVLDVSTTTVEAALRRGSAAGLLVTDPDRGTVRFRHALAARGRVRGPAVE